VVYRRFMAVFAILLLVAGGLLAWVNLKYDVGIALGGLDAALWIGGLGAAREYWRARRKMS
jgi:hypothetical protein